MNDMAIHQMIGLALIKVGIEYAAGGAGDFNRSKPTWGGYGNWFQALVVIVVTLGIKFYMKGFMSVAAVLLGLINATVRPVLFFLTLPLTLVTLGLFILVLNGLMFALVAWFIPGFDVAGFGSAMLGAIIVSLTSLVASWFIGPDGHYEVLITERRR